MSPEKPELRDDPGELVLVPYLRRVSGRPGAGSLSQLEGVLAPFGLDWMLCSESRRTAHPIPRSILVIQLS